MNKITKIGCSGIIALSFLGVQAQQINPMTEAVLRNYSEILAENPKDYMTLYDRASQYLNIGDLVRALSDIDMALENTPEKDVAYRVAELSLKSEIQTAMGKYDDAIQSLKSCLLLQPSSPTELYKLGNLYLMTNKPDEALKIFQQLQRETPRSQDAFYGMAKANIMMGKNDEASNLLGEIESLGQQSYLTYCRLGDLYSDMGDIQNATKNYLIAYTMTSNSSRPLESLKVLSKKDPRKVIESINGMLSADPENYPLNYVKAIIAYDQGLYADSEKAAKDLAANLDEESPSVYRMMAISQLALNKQQEALENILKAESLSPNNMGILLDKAEIMMSQNPKDAYQAAKNALSVNQNNEQALNTAARAAILAGEYQDALGYLNNLILSNPSDGEALLLRGYLNSEYLKDGKSGVNDYTRAGNIHQDGSVTNMVMAALGKAKSGKKLDSEGMINDAVAKAGNDKDALYLIAIYYAQTDNLQKAKEYADKAMINGYGNLYNLNTNNTPLLNLGPIHHLLGK